MEACPIIVEPSQGPGGGGAINCGAGARVGDDVIEQFGELEVASEPDQAALLPWRKIEGFGKPDVSDQPGSMLGGIEPVFLEQPAGINALREVHAQPLGNTIRQGGMESSTSVILHCLPVMLHEPSIYPEREFGVAVGVAQHGRVDWAAEPVLPPNAFVYVDAECSGGQGLHSLFLVTEDGDGHFGQVDDVMNFEAAGFDELYVGCAAQHHLHRLRGHEWRQRGQVLNAQRVDGETHSIAGDLNQAEELFALGDPARQAFDTLPHLDVDSNGVGRRKGGQRGLQAAAGIHVFAPKDG